MVPFGTWPRKRNNLLLFPCWLTVKYPQEVLIHWSLIFLWFFFSGDIWTFSFHIFLYSLSPAVELGPLDLILEVVLCPLSKKFTVSVSHKCLNGSNTNPCSYIRFCRWANTNSPQLCPSPWLMSPSLLEHEERHLRSHLDKSWENFPIDVIISRHKERVPKAGWVTCKGVCHVQAIPMGWQGKTSTLLVCCPIPSDLPQSTFQS